MILFFGASLLLALHAYIPFRLATRPIFKAIAINAMRKLILVRDLNPSIIQSLYLGCVKKDMPCEMKSEIKNQKGVR